MNIYGSCASPDNRQITSNVDVEGRSLSELLVFGYSCKLFRDDEPATHIELNKHLITCPCEETILIDRYDCRASMVSISNWTADGFSKSRFTLSLEESATEHHCNVERYADLPSLVNGPTAAQSHVENAERDRQLACIPYCYENENENKEEPDVKDKDEPYLAPESLKIPYGMEMPKTSKQNRIIEKTALFISKHGLQMEILMKTKQADNRQFDFLRYDDCLNPFYKHMLEMIKCNQYNPDLEEERRVYLQSRNDDSDESDTSTCSYLHPRLLNKSSCPSMTSGSQIDLSNTPYGKLIKSLELIRRKEQEKRQAREAGSFEETESELGEERSSSPPDIIPPPPDVLPVVDKLADYVARNGSSFEESVRQKRDKRFAFIETGHIHYKYYLMKKRMFEEQNVRREEERRKLDAYEREQIQNAHIRFLIRETKSLKVKHPSGCREGNHLRGERKPLTERKESEDSEFLRMTDSDNNEDDELESMLDVSHDVANYYDPLKEEDKRTHLEGERRKDRVVNATRQRLAAVDSRRKQQERRKKAELFLQNLKQSPAFAATGGTKASSIRSLRTQAATMERLLLVDRSIRKRQQSRLTAKSVQDERGRNDMRRPSATDLSCRKRAASDLTSNEESPSNPKLAGSTVQIPQLRERITKNSDTVPKGERLEPKEGSRKANRK